MTKVSNKEILGLFWRISRPYKHRRNLTIFFAIITLAITIFVGPLIIAELLNIIQNGQLDNAEKLWKLVALYGMSELWSNVIGWRLVLYLAWTFETALQRDLYAQCFSKLTNQTMFFHANKFGGSLVSQTNKLNGAVERFWDTIIWSILPLVISLVGSIIILSTLLWQYAVFLLLFSIIFSIVVYFGSRPMAKLNEKEAKASNKVSGQLADAVSNILAVKSSGAEALEQQRFAKTVTSWRGASLGTMRGLLKVSTVYSTINITIKIGAIAFAIYAAQHNIVSVAAVYLIITYTGSVAHELWNMNSIMRSYNRILGDAHDMVEILTTPTTLVDQSDAKLAVTRGSITIDNVTFTHDEGAGDTLFHDFSLRIQPGEKLAWLGRVALVKLPSPNYCYDLPILTQERLLLTHKILPKLLRQVYANKSPMCHKSRYYFTVQSAKISPTVDPTQLMPKLKVLPKKLAPMILLLNYTMALTPWSVSAA